jgi:phenylpropionate dioxygenase-like ring-hydroxylating dioxygenase large terminal subunit
MIPDQWYAVLTSDEVRPGRPVGVTRLGEKLVLWRDEQGRVACAADCCPHRGAALSAGEVVGGAVACPFHGFRFDPSGRCVEIPANGASAPVPKVFQARAFPAREAHGFIYLWNGTPRAGAADYPPLPWFEDIDGSFSFGVTRSRWKTHYSRAIENQLDVVHLPFVHRRSIGRGNKRIVNGPPTTLDDVHGLRVWVENAVDQGQTPKKPGDYPAPPDRPHQLRFLFPNLWENRISDDLRVLVAFAPIDGENTLMYLGFFQRFMRTPILRGVGNWLGARSNTFVAGEDQPVVETQRPFRTDLKMDEKLIPGDAPIILYRRRRRELIDAARGER